MPIYAYRCDACGHAKDVLQKLSAAPLTTCPACGKETFSKVLTAPAFQLKGSGWYVTDFRDNGKKPAADAPAAADAATPAAATPAPAATPAAAPAAAPASTPAASPTPPPAPAAGS